MSDTTLDRLELIVGRLEALGVTPALANEITAAAVDPDGYPAAVVPGDVIESPWGNATVDKLQKIKGLTTAVNALAARPRSTYAWTRTIRLSASAQQISDPITLTASGITLLAFFVNATINTPPATWTVSINDSQNIQLVQSHVTSSGTAPLVDSCAGMAVTTVPVGGRSFHLKGIRAAGTPNANIDIATYGQILAFQIAAVTGGLVP